MNAEFIAEDARWEALQLDAILSRVCNEIAQRLALSPQSEVTVLGCDDTRIAELNADFRGKPSPTNVLSWPAHEVTPPELPEPDPDGSVELGDIALAYETCLREAEEQQKSASDHVTHLIVHGLLHLLGYDHIRDEDATLMEALEVEILGKLGVEDPYS